MGIEGAVEDRQIEALAYLEGSTRIALPVSGSLIVVLAITGCAHVGIVLNCASAMWKSKVNRVGRWKIIEILAIPSQPPVAVTSVH